MKGKSSARKFLAWLLCLVMVASMMALPVLADEETTPAAPAAERAEAPAPKAEAPAVKEEAPAPKAEAPTVKEEAPAPKAEAPAVREEAPAVREEAPVVREEAPVVREEAPVVREEAPVVQEEAPAANVTTPSRPVSRPSRPSVVVEVEPDNTPADEPAAVEITAPAVVEATTASGADASAADDGFEVDWDEVGLLKGGDWQIQEWGLARGEGGYYVYMSNNQGQTSIGITYYHDSSDAIRFRQWKFNGASLLDESEQRIAGSTLTVIRENGDNYRMEGFIPDTFFKETSFILSSGNVTLKSEDIPVLEGATAPKAPENPSAGTGKEVPEDSEYVGPTAAYNGIVIDGKFDDWAGVPRYDFVDEYDVNGYPKYPQLTYHFSVVWDGDWIYILAVSDGQPTDWDPSLRQGNWNSVCGTGPHGNGQWAIVTDLNQQLLVQPAVINGQPAITGIKGAQVAVNNTEWFGAPHMWEIAIPAESLPKYIDHFEFNPYLMGPVISGITDLQAADDTDKSFNGVVIDGKFADWDYYPMTTIEYATSGTQDIVRDAHGALWADDNILYGYVATNMQRHLEAKGGEFLADIALAFNGDRSYKAYPHDGNFYPRIVTFDANDNIIVLNEGTRLENGDYTFYIYDTRTAPEAPLYDAESNTTTYLTAADLRNNAFGVLKVHVDGIMDQAEFWLDMTKVADYIDKDGDSAFKTIEIQWGRLGQQWIAYAGTPTGPVISVALLVGAVGAPVCVSELRRRRLAKKSKADDEAK